MRNRVECAPLHPENNGRFRALVDDAAFNLAEILSRFPLPLRVLLVESETHSDKLLLPLGLSVAHQDPDTNCGTFLLTREQEEEFVVGVDIQGQNGFIIDVDADVNFYVADDPVVSRSSDIMRRRSVAERNENIGDIIPDQLICVNKGRLILCKPWSLLFKDAPPVLPFSRDVSNNMLDALTFGKSDPYSRKRTHFCTKLSNEFLYI